METKNGIKFYQVLVTDWHESSLDATYKHVFNYATLAEAMRCPFYVGDDNKHVGEGEKFVDPITGVEKHQYHFQYLDIHQQAIIELRHEKMAEDERGTKVLIYQVLIKEVVL